VTERILSNRELNRALLARQLLLERSELSLVRAVERIGGLQSQYAPSAYVSLWSRLAGLRRESLTRALERRRVVQATLMRATIHMVSARDFDLFAAGIRRRRLKDGPRRQAELVELLQAEGFPRMAWSGAGMWLDLVRVPPSGTWERRRADLYALADKWLGPATATEAQGLEHLVRRYLGGFGPASVNDLANWAGLPVTTFRPVLERLRLRRFRDERGGELIDLPRAPVPYPETPAPVRFLPTWEATLLVHARRTQILPEVYRSRVFDTKTPHSVPTFLVDGAVAGTWRYDDGRVRVEPFGRLTWEVRRELSEEAERLTEFHRD
jgi:hypothetical protein